MRHVLAALPLIALLLSCAVPTGPDDAQRTPGGIEVESSVPVDLGALDSAWSAALGCWQERLGKTLAIVPPRTVVKSGTRLPNGCHYWQQGLEWVAGTTGAREVWLADGPCMASTARHEYAHWIEVRATGATDRVYAGCDGSEH